MWASQGVKSRKSNTDVQFTIWTQGTQPRKPKPVRVAWEEVVSDKQKLEASWSN
jgi:hypothetical protein